MDDPRVSDEATGLPPLGEIGTDPAMIVLAWEGGEGVVQSPHTTETVAVRYLHLRGLIEAPADEPHKVEWTQVHIAVPIEHAMDVAAVLAGGD
ncbi:MAG: hypothetical protein V4472_24875 [Pseudomonadota bacterium]